MNSYKLLLADDSVTIRKVVELTFADEGIAVSAVADGQEAMRRFVEVQPDIVIVDVNMPAPNGYQICEMIKADPETQNIPVLLLVGSFEPFDQAEAERVGADGFMTKPFQTIRELVDKVNELLSPNATANAPGPETEDIDNLYKSSFEETLKMSPAQQAASIYGDAGMDDDLIETHHLSTEDDLINASYQSTDDQSDPIDLFESSYTSPPPVTVSDASSAPGNSVIIEPAYEPPISSAVESAATQNDPNETTKLEWPPTFPEDTTAQIGFRTQETNAQPVSALTGKPEEPTEPLEWPVDSTPWNAAVETATPVSTSPEAPSYGETNDPGIQIEWQQKDESLAGVINDTSSPGTISVEAATNESLEPEIDAQIDTGSEMPEQSFSTTAEQPVSEPLAETNAINDVWETDSSISASSKTPDVEPVLRLQETGLESADVHKTQPDSNHLWEADTDSTTTQSAVADVPQTVAGSDVPEIEEQNDPAEPDVNFEPRFVFDEPELLEISDLPPHEVEISTPVTQEVQPAKLPEMPAISPEFIDAVARLVVEKLSVGVIREIAQEAVPRIAENLIREALEDDGPN